MAMSLHPFQLLELNVISAQDLFQISRNMKTYAVAWVHPDRKLSTRVDTTGRTNPTWNDKFVFRVDEEFLRADTSAIMVEIYALHWFRDVLVGTVRVIVGNLLPPSIKSHRGRGQQHVGMRFVALQVWRLSGRPQGILNVGATVLDSSMRSMPLYTQLSSSAVGYRDLMGVEDHNHRQTDEDQPNPNYTALKPILRRTRSELERKPALEMEEELKSSGRKANVKSGSELGISFPGKKTGGSSVLSGSDIIFYRKEVPLLNDKRVKSGGADPTPKKTVNEKVVAFEGFDPPAKKAAAKQGEFIKNNKNGNYYWPGFITNNKQAPANQKMMTKNNSILSFSDVGPSPSEMAAIVAQRYPTEPSNSGWSVDESVEGLRSKLERWRMELPPVYDLGSYDPSSGEDSKRSLAKHRRRHTDGGATTTAAAGAGLFSCFGNVFGYECSCVCGKPPAGGTTVPVTSKEVATSRMQQSPWVQH